MEPYGVTGDVLWITGQQSVSFMLNGWVQTFLVCSIRTDAAGLVGTDFMASLGAVIGFECSKLLLTGNRKVHKVYIVPPTWHSFSEGKAGRNPQLRKREARSQLVSALI
jgi:hypothetical protein